MREKFNNNLREEITNPEFHEEEIDPYIEDIITNNPDIEGELTQLAQNEHEYENGRVEGTRKHCIDVAELALDISNKFPDLTKASGLLEDEQEQEKARWQRILVTSALLHDVGKNEVPSWIIAKPGKLTEEERAKVNQHVTLSRNIILEQIKDTLGQPGEKEIIAEIVYRHHFRDGYPEQEEVNKHSDPSIERMIQRLTEIVAVIDNFDSMRSFRYYRNPEEDKELLVKFLSRKFKGHDELISYLVNNLIEGGEEQ
ncbi:MAG: hypothetical protein A3J62_01485 [Candidatus Buchananbacteria bacterium RIFCSPHIGHO2_02_FULL_38_8]|uniref:HD-GYP domain-containing protein n=2 Tax=Candidatus Buchananiibacteriota TaxID=1817903 RepID=A0A1G1Y0Z2_9BACT|nr:MAG: hypothetical protein A2731_04280 [Candidatus Buchananbacteria bacterium RIFCSPHIGHO2_01_FULL_39_8]OGY47852.1 MAG: hypothetical protein A3J62_01485 [Candidatus Buchananbacteria bacterium RIFCSPHIGHO2_02_FULL_38_8]